MYRPGKLRPQGPKLMLGRCVQHELLSLAWHRTSSGQSSKVHVEAYHHGIVFVDVPAIEAQGGWLAITVEVSPDTQRWADRLRWPAFDQPGFYAIPVDNVGAYLRISYRLVGAMQFGLQWLGKSLSLG
jgi:hypothetical protein